jgi:hypothetical protein
MELYKLVGLGAPKNYVGVHRLRTPKISGGLLYGIIRSEGQFLWSYGVHLEL